MKTLQEIMQVYNSCIISQIPDPPQLDEDCLISKGLSEQEMSEFNELVDKGDIQVYRGRFYEVIRKTLQHQSTGLAYGGLIHMQLLCDDRGEVHTILCDGKVEYSKEH